MGVQNCVKHYIPFRRYSN